MKLKTDRNLDFVQCFKLPGTTNGCSSLKSDKGVPVSLHVFVRLDPDNVDVDPTPSSSPLPPLSTCPQFSHETALCWLSTGGSLPQWTPLPPHKIAMLIAQKRSMLTLLTNDQPSSPPVFTFLTQPHNVLSMMCLRSLMCLCLCLVCLIPQHFTLLTQPDNVLTMICLRLSAPVGKLYPLWERGH